MKSRLLIRALCVGAALLVPAGGLAVLGAGTAGAAALTVNFVVTSTAKIGTFGTATLIGVLCNIATKTVTGTKTCALIRTKSTSKLQIPIKNTAGTVFAHILLTGSKATFKVNATKKITGITFKSANILTLKIKEASTITAGKINTCKISGMPTISFSPNTATPNFKTTTAISGRTVSGCKTTSETLIVTNQLNGNTLKGILTT